jgi:hypothetical protein
MNKVTSNETFGYEIGKDFGESSSDVQANLLKGFAHGLQLGISQLDGERQIAYIVDELDGTTKAMLKAFVNMIDLEKEGF